MDNSPLGSSVHLAFSRQILGESPSFLQGMFPARDQTGYKVSPILEHSMVILAPELPEHQKTITGHKPVVFGLAFPFSSQLLPFSPIMMFPRALHKKYANFVSWDYWVCLLRNLTSHIYIQNTAYHSIKGILFSLIYVLLKRQSNNRGIILCSIMIP